MRVRATKPMLVIAAAATTVVVVGTGAVAAYSGTANNGQILSCWSTSTGAMRVVDHFPCKTGERPLSWNAKGQKGDTGAAGANGTQVQGSSGIPGAAGKDGKDGATGPAGAAGAPGAAGAAGKDGAPGQAGKDGKDAEYVGPNWSVVDRNVNGNGDSTLRSGPFTPPAGVGSLGIRTGSGSDKAAFGNQVDFAGQSLSDIDTVAYSVYTTRENRDLATNNLPSVAFEVNPHTARTFSTLLFVPTDAAANQWTKLDASTAKQWYFTGGAGTDSGCNQTTYCTLAEAKAAFEDATVYTVQITKGRDFAFSGAVDALQINDTTYDFEPFGVSTK